MEVAREVAHVAQDKRKHTEVTVYQEAGSDVYYYRVQIGGRRFKRSTGKTNYKEAVAQAKVIRRELQGDGQARSTMKRPGYATLGEVLAVWEQMSEAETRKNNMSAVRKWVRSFSSADPDGVCMTKLTGEQLERYLRAWPGSPVGRKSTGAQIRAVFAPEPMRWYGKAGLVLPDMSELRAVKIAGRQTEQRFEGFTPIPEDVLRRMDAAAERLRTARSANLRRLWAVYALMRWCGLRNIEVAALRWEWLVEGTKGRLWRIEQRRLEDGTWFHPKGRSGDVPMRAELLEQLAAATGNRKGFVIPRANPTEAETVTERTINRFVRRFIPDRNKGAYELRKQFGAQVALRDGLEVASRMLRHGSIQTTWKHYHALLHEPAPL